MSNPSQLDGQTSNTWIQGPIIKTLCYHPINQSSNGIDNKCFWT